MSRPHRIDVHHHLVPPFWAEALSGHGGDPSGWQSPAWSVESSVAFMDAQRIAKAVLSLTTPGVTGWHGAARRDIARQVNEFGAEVVARRPDRFGSFATLPLPDLEGAMRELEYSLDELRMDGVVLLSNYAGHYLGDRAFGRPWAELDRRAAVVFVHPAKPAIPIIEGIPGPFVDYPFDTTRTAVQLVLNGVVGRSPRVTIILSHAGGFLPYAAHRFAELAPAVRTDVPAPADLIESFRSYYFDTALSSGPASLLALQSFRAPRAHPLWQRLSLCPRVRRRVLHGEARCLRPLGQSTGRDRQRRRAQAFSAPHGQRRRVGASADERQRRQTAPNSGGDHEHIQTRGFGGGRYDRRGDGDRQFRTQCPTASR
jgi:predicted TIM-barrel fold metal-dependent hydrolase